MLWLHDAIALRRLTIPHQFSAGDFVADPWPVKYRNAVKLAA